MKEEQSLNIINQLPFNNIIMTSSFGIQSAVLIYLIQQSNKKDTPIIFLDTQYLFKETYEFKNELEKRFNLNIKTYQSLLSREEQEKKYNELWINDLKKYNEINKIEPMQRALKEYKTDFWISGIRSSQSNERLIKPIYEKKENYTKVHPIIHCTDKDIHFYLEKYDLPYHPLREKGYLSLGDTHSTKSIYEVNDISEIRFNGKQRECGLHI